MAFTAFQFNIKVFFLFKDGKTFSHAYKGLIGGRTTKKQQN